MHAFFGCWKYSCHADQSTCYQVKILLPMFIHVPKDTNTMTPLEVGPFCPCCCGSCQILSFWTTFLKRPSLYLYLLSTIIVHPSVGNIMIMKKCTGFVCFSFHLEWKGFETPQLCHNLGGSSYAGRRGLAPQGKLERNCEIHLGWSSPFWQICKTYGRF